MKISKSAVGAKLATNPLFPQFINEINSYNINQVFTVRGCFTDVDWNSYDTKYRLSLGRLVKNNIKCNNLTGIEIIPRLPNNNTQRYRVTGPIHFIQKLIIPCINKISDYNTLITKLDSSSNSAVVYYNSSETNGILKLNITCKKCASRTELFSFTKEIVIHNDPLDNKNTNVIKAIRSCLVGLWINESNLKDSKITTVYICSSNRSMLERISGKIVDSSNNQDYESMIQDYFNDFIQGNKMELNQQLQAIPVEFSVYKKFISNY